MERPLPLTPEARDALVASADGDGRFLLNQAETLFSIELAEPLDPAELASSSSAASRSTTRTARGITTSSPRCTNRSAAPTRRRRSTISRGCWSRARSRSTCCAA